MTTAKGVDSPAEAQHLLHITQKFVMGRRMAVRWVIVPNLPNVTGLTDK